MNKVYLPRLRSIGRMKSFIFSPMVEKRADFGPKDTIDMLIAELFVPLSVILSEF